MSNYRYIVVDEDNGVEIQDLHNFKNLAQAKKYAERMKSRFMHPGNNQYLVIYKFEKLEECKRYKTSLG